MMEAVREAALPGGRTSLARLEGCAVRIPALRRAVARDVPAPFFATCWPAAGRGGLRRSRPTSRTAVLHDWPFKRCASWGASWSPTAERPPRLRNHVLRAEHLPERNGAATRLARAPPPASRRHQSRLAPAVARGAGGAAGAARAGGGVALRRRKRCPRRGDVGHYPAAGLPADGGSVCRPGGAPPPGGAEP